MISAQPIVQDLKDVMEKRIAMCVKQLDMELDRNNLINQTQNIVFLRFNITLRLLKGKHLRQLEMCD